MKAGDKEAVTIEPWAAVVAGVTLLIVLATGASVLWDRAHTADVEKVTAPTAVGDTQYVAEPAAGVTTLPLQYKGQPLRIVSESKERDSKLIRAGAVDSGAYTLYLPEDPKEALPKEHFFMKMKPNIYMEVAPR